MGAKPYGDFVKKGRPWYTIVSSIVFSRFGLFFLCMLYAVGGAFLFMWIELPKEEMMKALKMEKSKEIDEAVVYLRSTFWQYATDEYRYNYTIEQFRAAAGEDLATLKTFVLTYAEDYGYDGTERWEYSWSFPKSLLFTITIITTIGYGHIFPITASGKLVCILYSFIGIPLLLIFMTDVSEMMAGHVTYIYSRLCCRWCRVRRRDNELSPDADRRQNSIRTDKVGKEMYMPTEEVRVPIMVNLILMLTYLFVGSVAFTYAEDWPVGTAIYFCFVTLSTIGFGDFVPQKTFVEATEKKTIGGMLMMAFTIAYCIFGIMLLSLSLGLMQKQIMEKLEWIGGVVGMDGQNSNEEIVKRFKQKRINKTPIGMTGNELNFNEKRIERQAEREQWRH